MSDEVRVRKDGRPLVTEHPVTAMDEIEYLGHVPSPERVNGIACGLRGDRHEAWMDDI